MKVKFNYYFTFGTQKIDQLTLKPLKINQL